MAELAQLCLWRQGQHDLSRQSSHPQHAGVRPHYQVLRAQCHMGLGLGLGFRF